MKGPLIPLENKYIFPKKIKRVDMITSEERIGIEYFRKKNGEKIKIRENNCMSHIFTGFKKSLCKRLSMAVA